MNEIHLFAGGGGGIIGGMLLGHTCICAVEINSYCQKVLWKRQSEGILPTFPVYGDIRKFDGTKWRGKADIVCGGFPCFIAGTKILTYTGHKNIEDIRIGDFVLTHKGRWRKVTKVGRRRNIQIRCITGGGGQYSLYTTNEHPFYSRKRYREWNNSKRTYIRLFEQAKWTKAKEITKDTFVGTIAPKTNKKVYEFSEGIFWLAGRYLADGWLATCNGKGRVVVAIGSKKAKAFEQKMEEYGFSPCVSKEHDSGYTYIFTRQYIYEFCKQFGKYANGKYIPGFIFEQNNTNLRCLFNGYFSGDGSTDKKGLKIASTVSECLALSLQLLWQKIEGIAYITKHKRKSTTIIEGRKVNTNPIYTIAFHEKTKTGFIDGQYIWRSIRENTITGQKETVYNLEVDEDNSYTANNIIVHNCTDISIAGKGVGIEGEESGLWKEMARVIGEIQPKYAFVENAPILYKRGLTTVISDFAEMGYDAVWGVLGADDVGGCHSRKRCWILATNPNL